MIVRTALRLDSARRRQRDGFAFEQDGGSASLRLISIDTARFCPKCWPPHKIEACFVKFTAPSRAESASGATSCRWASAGVEHFSVVSCRWTPLCWTHSHLRNAAVWPKRKFLRISPSGQRAKTLSEITWFNQDEDYDEVSIKFHESPWNIHAALSIH